jgi:CBS domain-containing protein
MNKIAETLAIVAPFSELSSEQRTALAGEFELREASAGDEIGIFDPPGRDGLFVIVDGAVELFDLEDHALEQRGSSELFGHAIVFEDGVSAYRVSALENCQMLWLPPKALAAVSESHELLGRFLSGRPGERLQAETVQRTGTLRDLDLRAPVTAAPELSIRAAAALMAAERVSCLPVVGDQSLVGIVTDRDLRSRVLAKGLDPERPIADIMTAEPVTVGRDTRFDDAVVEMMRLAIHHLPVIDENRRLVGVISAGDLIRHESPHPLRLVRDIQRAATVEQIADFARQGPGLLAHLVGQGHQVFEVGRMASMITDACTRRLLGLALREYGDAPFDWCWMAFGSQARMEQGLISDQDNGLLLAERPEGDDAEYFLKLATFVCDGLDACGYVYCKGDVMAMKKWRMSLSDWLKTFERWMSEPEPESVMNCSIFFDQRGIAGNMALARDLQEEVLAQARTSRIFLRFLAAESIGHTPPVGLFRQFLQEDRDGEGKGINLKKRGVLPIVDLARVRALESAIAEVHTEERIRAASSRGPMNERDAEDLVHALRFIGNVRLRHQVALYERGEPPDHLVSPDELSGLHRRYLRSAFGIVRDAQKALAQRYQL